MRVLVAGMGNVLRGDDGFGVEVARLLASRPLPPEVEVIEVGIGGIHMVQELFGGVDALVVVDAMDRGRAPGTILVVEPDILDVNTVPLERRRDLLADMHYAEPGRALMLARAVGVLPERVLVVGCQPQDADRLGEGLSPPVADAVAPTADEVERIVAAWLRYERGEAADGG